MSGKKAKIERMNEKFMNIICTSSNLLRNWNGSQNRGLLTKCTWFWTHKKWFSPQVNVQKYQSYAEHMGRYNSDSKIIQKYKSYSLYHGIIQIMPFIDNISTQYSSHYKLDNREICTLYQKYLIPLNQYVPSWFEHHSWKLRKDIFTLVWIH